MSWTILVPLNIGRPRKTRLADVLPASARTQLADAIGEHVLEVLLGMDEIERVIVVSPESPGRRDVTWKQDLGRGLNAELEVALSEIDGAVAIVLGDLPLLTVDSVRALLQAAKEHGIALAPDRSAAGTNAIAMASGKRIALCFGANSLALHSAGGSSALVDRPALALDVDQAEDLEAAHAAGWRSFYAACN